MSVPLPPAPERPPRVDPEHYWHVWLQCYAWLVESRRRQGDDREVTAGDIARLAGIAPPTSRRFMARFKRPEGEKRSLRAQIDG